MQKWLIIIWKNFVHLTILRIWSNNSLAPKILIGHILINHPKSFHLSRVYETGLSDFHILTLTVLKTYHVKHKPKIMQYRDFNHFDNALFRADLLQELSLKNVLPGNFEKFKYISPKVLNIHASIKKNMLEVTILPSWVNNSRSSRSVVFCKKGVLRNFAKFTCTRVSFLIKLQKETSAIFLWILRDF